MYQLLIKAGLLGALAWLITSDPKKPDNDGAPPAPPAPPQEKPTPPRAKRGPDGKFLPLENRGDE